MRTQPNAKTAILALGAPAYLAASASEKATAAGVPTDVYVVNGFPLEDGLPRRPRIALHARPHHRGRIDRHAGRRACRVLPALAASSLASAGVALHHFGIVDPAVAPSETFVEVWEHFGISEKHLLDALLEKP